ncbi:MAG: alpha-glucuronidase [Lachnospiraceae bacterium]|nr:alpha-glucuronidase [Lachnospiraceae bacterium]
MMAENYTKLWLDYNRRKDMGNGALFKNISVFDFSDEHSFPVIQNALEELTKGAASMLGVIPIVLSADRSAESAGVDYPAPTLSIRRMLDLGEETYHIEEHNGKLHLHAGDEKGVLYGAFHILRLIAMEQPLEGLDVTHTPDCPLRMLNHWDNLDGSIERGYSGRSFFFDDNEILVDDRTRQYARLIASIGINAVVINNVNVKNAASLLITDTYFEKVAEIARIFGAYGIKLYLSLNYASPMEIGGMDTVDPLEPSVGIWWESKMDEIFRKIPNLGGFLVKADSEGRPGPFTYGRTQADGANMLADIVKKYDARIIWRAFVYNCQQDWRDTKTDRACAGYNSFHPVDGTFRENVILQVKNGPMDFQIREGVSSLFGGMEHTNEMLEVQIAQEYTGQQIDLCYLMPMFREILDFRTYCRETNDTVADIISGRCFGNKNTGIAAVTNTGNDRNWTGNDLAAANLYGFGRLASDLTLSPEAIAREWIALTYGNDPLVTETILKMLLESREIYEQYTSPLGVGWMVTPSVHYGPFVDGYEYSRWGCYHRADHLGIGIDRTKEGSDYVSQYHEPNTSLYNDIETCPEELLLFFHHVPYTYRLKSGKTLIQHIYDSHFEGYERALGLQESWKSLKDRLPLEVYHRVEERLIRQVANAREWRDQVNTYFYRKSGIPDEKGREIY